MIIMLCPKCATELHIDEKYAGTTGSCRKCGTMIMVPTGSSTCTPRPAKAQDEHVGDSRDSHGQRIPTLRERLAQLKEVKEEKQPIAGSEQYGQLISAQKSTEIQSNNGEAVSVERPTKSSSSFFIPSLIAAIVILYFGGWNIVWGASFQSQSDFLPIHEDVLINTRTMAIRVGGEDTIFGIQGSYYGLAIENRFFDSPTISWLCLGAAIACVTGSGLKSKN